MSNPTEKRFIKKPFYKGGQEALNAFISKNIQYPAPAQQAQLAGVVIVQYDIDYKGFVKNAKVLSGIGHGCDEEAVRLISLLKFEVPKQTANVKVVFHKTTHIRFGPGKPSQMEQEMPPAQNAQIHYQITYNPQTKPTTSPSYNYTVNF